MTNYILKCSYCIAEHFTDDILDIVNSLVYILIYLSTTGEYFYLKHHYALHKMFTVIENASV